ncbi:MAG: PsiF family protein [Burkholderiales bacterium]
MKTMLRHAAALAAAAALTALPAHAADGSARAAAPAPKAGEGAPTTQQDRMKKCNAKAKEKALKGDERRAFMSSCLKK